MKRILFSTFLAALTLLALPAVAASSAPAPDVNRLIEAIAGRPSTATCYTKKEWQVKVAAVELTPDTHGFTYPALADVHLPDYICGPLLRQLSQKKVNAFALGEALHVLVHESIHARGIFDENVTECLTVKEEARWAIILLGFKSHSKSIRAVLVGAYDFHSRMPAEYQGGQC